MKIIIALALLMSPVGLLAQAKPHSVTIGITASPDAPATLPAGSGYNIYVQSGACPATAPVTLPATGFSLVNTTPTTALTFTDSGMGPGDRCYFATFVLSGAESNPSNDVQATIKPASPSVVVVVTIT